MITGWYLFSSCSSFLSKSLMTQGVQFPLMISIFQFGFSASFALCMIKSNKERHRLHRLTQPVLARLLPIVLALIVSKVCFLLSLGEAPLSFTHTIKSSSPIFAVLLARIFLQEHPSPQTYLCLFFICGGVSLASLAELRMEVTFMALFTALLSTVSQVAQSLLSKMLFNETRMDSVNLSFYMSFLAMCVLSPAAFYFDYAKLAAPGAPGDPGAISKQAIWLMLAASGLCYFLQNLFSFIVLHHMSAVTHTVLGTAKRLVVIVSSVLIFGNKISAMNALGISIAIAGVAYYNRLRYLEAAAKRAGLLGKDINRQIASEF
eukprot:tig00020830_g14423.t1